MKPTLSRDGQKLRERIAEAGIELTPDELATGLAEAFARGGYGPCVNCGQEEELRLGWCFDCVMGGEE